MRNQSWSGQLLTQICSDLLDERAARTREEERIFRAAPFGWENDQVLGKELRIARDVQTFEIDRLANRAPVFARDENKFVRLFVRGDERAEKIRGNPPAAPADAWHRPRDRFAEQILFAEDRREPRGQRDRKRRRSSH